MKFRRFEEIVNNFPGGLKKKNSRKFWSIESDMSKNLFCPFVLIFNMIMNLVLSHLLNVYVQSFSQPINHISTEFIEDSWILEKENNKQKVSTVCRTTHTSAVGTPWWCVTQSCHYKSSWECDDGVLYVWFLGDLHTFSSGFLWLWMLFSLLVSA